MDGMEIIILLLSLAVSGLFFYKWYSPVMHTWPPGRAIEAKAVLFALPVAAFVIIMYTLVSLASFDVVGSGIYVLFYLALGFAWLYLGKIIMTRLFDLSYIDDALGTDNKAALFPISGGFLGLSVIYAAANIGDGPGWWCVIFAGGLGLIAWIVLAMLINALTGVFERVTIGRDTGCGIRLSCYLLASGIILGRASAGDWTSFSMTVVEFSAGWPALPLAALAVLAERVNMREANVPQPLKAYEREGSGLGISLFFGIALIAFAIVSVVFLLPPMTENPMYR